mgnify:CR=1 FL=1
MTTLTTRQRDLLSLLIESDGPVVASVMAERMQLTPRQVNYDLKGLRAWLAKRDISLNAKPGVGAELICSGAKSEALLLELKRSEQFQLVLSIEQRQQLFALTLLVADKPIILNQLQLWSQLSRTTILKDLDVVEEWVKTNGLKLNRRPNYGFDIVGSEQLKRQAIATLLWSQTSLGKPLTIIDFAKGLSFSMDGDAKLLPLVAKVDKAIGNWDVKRSYGHVAFAEAQLGGRFTDDAVRIIALVFAIQYDRVNSGHTVDKVDQTDLSWLQARDVWEIASDIARHLGRHLNGNWPITEIAQIAMYLLTAPRNERWPDDLQTDRSFSELINKLMQVIVDAYKLPALANDKTLHDGLVTHIVPACLRYRFKIWFPTDFSDAELPAKLKFERDLSSELAQIIEQRMEVVLPQGEINNIAMMLRAAYIREHPGRVRDVIVVCPSGMASAQLLVARLSARFSGMGTFRVVSLRELGQGRIDSAELVITTVPLGPSINTYQKNVIQVHPLLLPEDVEKITRWLA